MITTRTEIINTLIKQHNLKSYLEIGLCNPELNFRKIDCEFKESCDPFIYNPDEDGINKDDTLFGFTENGELKREISDFLTYRLTSDELFAMTPYDKKWDIIFIDGLHLHEQVTKDILNALKHLNEGGFIVVHDCLPVEEEVQNRNRTTLHWNGDVWKAVARLGELGMKFKTFDTDEGVAVIPYQKFSNVMRYKCFDTDYLTWKYFEEHRNALMHVVPELDIDYTINENLI